MKRRPRTNKKHGRARRSSKPKTWDSAKRTRAAKLDKSDITGESIKEVAAKISSVTGWSEAWILKLPQSAIFRLAEKHL